MRHCTVGITLRNLPKRSFCGLERERVQQRNSALKILLNFGIAGGWEVYRPELLFPEVVVVVAFVGTRGKGQRNESKQECDGPNHGLLRPESIAQCRGGQFRAGGETGVAGSMGRPLGDALRIRGGPLHSVNRIPDLQSRIDTPASAA